MNEIRWKVYVLYRDIAQRLNPCYLAVPWKRKALYCAEGGRWYRLLYRLSFSYPVGLFFVPYPGLPKWHWKKEETR